MNGNDMAFPVLDRTQTPNGSEQLGLTKRELIAAIVLAGNTANSIPGMHHQPAQAALEAVEHAEALIDQLAPKQKVPMGIELYDVLDALRKYEQIDLNGVYVKVSRAALEEAIEVIESRYR